MRNFMVFIILSLTTLGAFAASIPVITAPVIEQNTGEMVRIKATTQAIQQANVTPQIAGVVQSIQFKSGQSIQKDAVLFRLEDSVAAAQLKKAEAMFRYHDLNLSKYKQLIKSNAVSQIEVQRLQAERDQAFASLDELKANLALYSVKAPFTGKLGLSDLSLGQYIVPGNIVVHLSDSSQLLVDFPVPEKYSDDVKKLKQVRVVSDHKQHMDQSATIMAIDDQFINNTHALKVRAQIDNSKDIYTAGSFVTVYFPTQTEQKLLSFPASALIFNANGTFVYTLKNNLAHLQAVELSHVGDDRALILNGLTLNDKVVVSGQINLHEGVEVKVVNNTGKI